MNDLILLRNTSAFMIRVANKGLIALGCHDVIASRRWGRIFDLAAKRYYRIARRVV